MPQCDQFDARNCYFFGLNPSLMSDLIGGQSQNRNLMTLIAIAIEDTQWEQMCNGSSQMMA